MTDINGNAPRLTSTAPDSRIRGLCLTAMFAGSAAAAGYLLMSIPNVEAITGILFTAGFALGVSRGIIAAVVAAVIYFGFNPQGGLFPPLLAAQIIGISAAPIAGAIFKRINARGGLKLLCLAVTAVVVTLWYDLLTNLAFPLAAGFDSKGILITLAAGIPFSIVHVASNVAIFIILIPQLLNLIIKRFPTAEK